MRHLVFLFLLPILFLACSEGTKETWKPDDAYVLQDGFDSSAEAGDVLEDQIQDLKDAQDALDSHETQIPYVNARKTATEEDMVKGDNAWGIVSHSYILENNLVRFLIQDKGTAVHLCVYGGNLIDADKRHMPSEKGTDQFRELFPAVGFRVTDVQSVTVLKDGSDGVEAVIRVEGMDAPTHITSMLDNLAQPLQAKIRTDYILKPDVPYLIIRTEVENQSDQPLQNIPVGDFVSFGGASRFFTPQGGFGGSSPSVTAIASTGRGASYAYTVQTGDFIIPYSESNATLTMLQPSLNIEPKGVASYERYFIVGDGDIASAMAWVYRIRGEDVVLLEGKVVDETGAPIQGAVITVFREGEALSGRALTQAITKEDGTYKAMLPKGKYDVVASAEGRKRVIKNAVDIAKFRADFTFGPKGMVLLEIREKRGDGGLGDPIPAKVSLYCLSDGEEPNKEIGEYAGRGLCDVLFSAGKLEEVPVKPGHYKAVVSRGIEYETVVIEDLEVKGGQTTTISANLERVLDTSGFLSCDLHQHTFGSIDAPLSHKEKVVENVAEGVELAGITDHDNMTSYDQAIEALGLEGFIKGINGDEVSATGRGHFNIFAPRGTKEELDPFRGAQLYAFRTIKELVAFIRQNVPGVRVVQMNHPRDGFDAYLIFSRFDPVTGIAYGTEELFTDDFDTIEVKDSLGEPEDFVPESDARISQMARSGSHDIPVLRDFFGFLNTGKTITAVGVSDAHNKNDGVGYQRNFIKLGTDKPFEVTVDQVLDAILAQKVIVSNGPMIRFRIGEKKEPLGHTEIVKAQGDEVLVEIWVLAASWMDVSRLEIYANGRPLHLQVVANDVFEFENPENPAPFYVPLPLGDVSGSVERAHTFIHLYPKSDTYYVFVVKGEGSLEPVGRGAPFAYTNPVYVDADGDGKFTLAK